jgi:uncharacterized membrane protein
MTSPNSSRLAYIDWMRGLACILMFQTHCYDAWLSPRARKTTFYMWSQLGGTLPAPLFLFLAGISFALVTDKLRTKDVPAAQIASKTIRRGAEILALGFLFRFQEFLIAWGWSPWSDLLRVDVLNIIGVSMMLMGGMCWIVFSLFQSTRIRLILCAASVSVGLIISFLTPLLWTTWRPRWLPWPIESYFDGVHNFGQPQSWLFPIFPWVGFAFAGLALGFLLLGDWVRKQEAKTFLLAGVGGIGLIYLAHLLDVISWQPFGIYNFWLTSPNFFLMRVGMLLAIMSASYAWCRWGAGQWGFSPLIQLGQTSLLVYWVHFDFVYGRVSILPKRADDVRTASIGLVTIFLAMLLLSILRTRFKKTRRENPAMVQTPATIG